MTSSIINEFVERAQDVPALELDLFISNYYCEEFTIEENLMLLEIFKICIQQ